MQWRRYTPSVVRADPQSARSADVTSLRWPALTPHAIARAPPAVYLFIISSLSLLFNHMLLSACSDQLASLRFALQLARSEDRALSNFLLWNMAKAQLITHGFLLSIYFARFKNYRNSYLLLMHVPATLLGLSNGLAGTRPVLQSYLFSQCELPLAALEDPLFSDKARQTLTLGERQLVGDVGSLCYLADYFTAR